ncbi:LacI family DNA-binding transcriptional regulator [Allonocardiopsis opalescens]|uniref:LacI family transcriptional regulator n=1 Tax=Allonocardiopsis opalescens TaxID=1144618 RepID=A0A2T0QCQ6_9ACTN|nr:substrate-binding domain-containing protein [Allonocardiopsis opalescens]PRY01699.1 LacI family transcriptional regulator [Allonocardiopsis opalescens]
MRPTVGIREVAERASVSPGTVSNVLNRPERVAAPTRARVLAAIDELGFVRNGSASTLRAGHSRAVGLMVLDIANPFFTEAARGVEDVISERGYALMLSNSDEDAVKERRNLRMLAEQRVQGLLVTPVDDEAPELLALRERGVSVVLLDRPGARPDQCSVAVDDVAGGRLAVEHLLRLGRRDIAYVSGPPGIRQCDDRREGARRALDGADGARLREFAAEGMNVRGGLDAGQRLLAGRRTPDAVFCANDLLALGVMRALLRAGARVPDDVAVLGYDDIEFAAAAAVPLSSVRQPTYQLGRLGTELLLDECENPDGHAHQQVVFQPELVARDSTG